MQSHAGFIDLLPAIPDVWKEKGDVKGLKAEGNDTVNMKWYNGKISDFKILTLYRKKVKVGVNGSIRTVKAKEFQL